MLTGAKDAGVVLVTVPADTIKRGTMAAQALWHAIKTRPIPQKNNNNRLFSG